MKVEFTFKTNIFLSQILPRWENDNYYDLYGYSLEWLNNSRAEIARELGFTRFGRMDRTYDYDGYTDRHWGWLSCGGNMVVFRDDGTGYADCSRHWFRNMFSSNPGLFRDWNYIKTELPTVAPWEIDPYPQSRYERDYGDWPDIGGQVPNWAR